MAKKKSSEPSLSIKQCNGWNIITARERKAIFTFGDAYREFLSYAKTERLASSKGVETAQKHGYTDLAEHIVNGDRLKPGQKVYYSVAGKTLILVRIGKRPIEEGMRIIGAHTDSPRLDLKPRPLYEDGGMALLDTHYYGGIRKYQWVTIPLAMHGVVSKKDGSSVKISIGEDPSDPVLAITDLLPHLAKDQNDKKLGIAITGEGLNVVCGSIPANSA